MMIVGFSVLFNTYYTRRSDVKAKRLSVSVVVLVTICILAVSSYAEIIPEAVVGIWLFDEDGGDIAKDSSGNGHDGMIEGNVKWANGKFKSSLQFPGESGADRVIVQSDDSMKLGEWTIVAWIKIGSTGAEQMFVVKSGPDQAMRNYACSVNPSLLQAQFADKSIMENGLEAMASFAVSSAGKLAITWAKIRT